MKNFFDKFCELVKQQRKEILFIAILLLVSGLAAGWNMFHYPSYFDDEGTYMARAIAVAYHHSLAPYTYWYDHAPGGSIIIGIWLRLTGGVHTFGSAINSGRVLMLIVHLLSSFFLYLIAKHYKIKKFFIAAIMLFFCLSPLSITLQRMVLLDNLMVLALLSSLYLIIHVKNIYIMVLSGILMGLAVLIKETAIFFIPGILILLFQKKPRHYRKFTSIAWVTAFTSTVLTYPVFALLRGEFFPAHSLFGGESPHVSLITSLLWQASRKGGVFYLHSSQFYYSLVHSWLFTDPLLIVMGMLSSLAIFIISFWKRQYLPIAILTFGYIYYLMRGGIVNDQYLIPLIPFFALNIGLAFSEAFNAVKDKHIFKHCVLTILVGLCLVTLAWDIKNPDLYIVNGTAPQIKAINWFNKNNSKTELTEIDSYAQADLLYIYGSQIYKNYGYQDFWEVDQDPRLTSTVLHNKWESIDYILLTPRMLTDLAEGSLPLTKDAINNSITLVKYRIHYPNTGISGYLYKQSYHRQILIAITPYVDINKVNKKN